MHRRSIPAAHHFCDQSHPSSPETPIPLARESRGALCPVHVRVISSSQWRRPARRLAAGERVFYRARIAAHLVFDEMPRRRSNTKKLKLMAAKSDEDRISALSNRLVHRVLSFLPAHEAVRTCLLSRRWRDVWKSMPVVRVIDPCSWGSPAEFNKFVNHLLFFRDQTPLEEFQFATYPYSPQMQSNAFADSVEPFRYLQLWIRYALMRKVRVLRVRAISLREPPRLFNGPLISQHLVTLELFCVVLDGYSMDFSRCPLLEDLKISCCRIPAHKMSSQSIRHLSITSCEFPDHATRLQIFVPNLVALKLHENDGLTLFLGSMPLLVTAFVGLHHWPDSFRDRCWHTNLGDDCGLDPCIECYGSEKCVVLGGLSNATSLQFQISGFWSWENILKRDLKWCSSFTKLKTLVLNGWVVVLAGYDVRGLICFLQHTLFLEKLVLQIYDELTFEKKIDESCSLAEQFIPTEHLKIVEVSCHKDVQNVDKLVETLIACSIPPNIISINRSDS